MATRNAFTLRGALGGVMAADKDLLDKKSQELEQTNMAIKAMAAADQVRRERQFQAREREMDLKRAQEGLIKEVRGNKIGALYDESDRATAAKTKKATARIKTEEADLKEEFGERETVANIEGREATTEATKVDTKLAPSRVAQGWQRLSQDRQRIALQAARDTQDKIEWAGGETRRNVELARQQAQLVRENFEAKVTATQDPEELAALREEVSRADANYKNALVEKTRAETKETVEGRGKSKNLAKITTSMEKAAYGALVLMGDRAAFSTPEDKNRIALQLVNKMATLSNTTTDMEWAQGEAVRQLEDEGRAIQVPKWTFDTGGGVPVRQEPHWKYVSEEDMRSAGVALLDREASKAPSSEALKQMRRAYQKHFDKDVPKELLDKYPGMQ